MAGSWEPLLFRVRRDGSDGYTPTAEQRADYQAEHSPEMVARLKAMGVNFVMMHCYKGAGLEAERQSMADAVRFARLCHDQGLRVGVYNYSGAFIWDLFFKEVPAAKDWVVYDARGTPQGYGKAATYRYYWNRNHPDAEAFYRQLVRFAVQEIRTDLIHFDNYNVGPGHDANSIERFRDYLRRAFTPAMLREAGVADLSAVRPPGTDSPPLLRHAWDEFRCRSITDSYHAMSRYARTLRPDILVECNPAGVGARITPPVNHGQLLKGGEAFWDEGLESGFANGKLKSRIRTYKVARAMDNSAFCYSTTPLEMAESMAFNLDCLGAICWFEYGRITKRPGFAEPMSPDLAPFVRFFHQRRDLLRNAEVVADVAVLRSFPSQVFAGSKPAALTYQVEEQLIGNRVCFQIIYDHQLAQLRKYRALVLAGCVAMSNAQIEAIKTYVNSGGRLCVIGPAATHDEWMQPRAKAALDDLPAARVLRVAEKDNSLEAIRRVCGSELSLTVDAPAGVCAELTGQPGRRLLHLVNYRAEATAKNVSARVRVPSGRRAQAVALASPQRAQELKIPFTQADDFVTFTVPEIPVYEIAVISVK